MEEQRRLGRWSKLFGGSLRFESEAARAKEIGAVWTPSADGRQVDVLFDSIEGCGLPAWGSDSTHLYLRRPEGVWKTRIDQGLVDRIGLIRQRLADGSVSDHIVLGRGFKDKGGWIFSGMTPATPGQIDALVAFQPPSDQPEVKADLQGCVLYDFIERSEHRDVVEAGEPIGLGKVAFSRVGDWLVAKDIESGWRTAYDLSENRSVKASLEANRLWLRYGTGWMTPIEVKIDLVTP